MESGKNTTTKVIVDQGKGAQGSGGNAKTPEFYAQQRIQRAEQRKQLAINAINQDENLSERIIRLVEFDRRSPNSPVYLGSTTKKPYLNSKKKVVFNDGVMVLSRQVELFGFSSQIAESLAAWIPKYELITQNIKMVTEHIPGISKGVAPTNLMKQNLGAALEKNSKIVEKLSEIVALQKELEELGFGPKSADKTEQTKTEVLAKPSAQSNKKLENPEKVKKQPKLTVEATNVSVEESSPIANEEHKEAV